MDNAVPDSERLAVLEEQVRALTGRVYALEHPERAETIETIEAQAEDAKSVAVPAELGPVEPPAPSRAGTPPAPVFSFEDFLGGRVLAWLGGVAVLLAVVFFLGLAISRGWIDEPTRVVLAFLGSSALLLGGLWLYERKGQTEAALAAMATAVAALYASLTTATTVYELVSPEFGLGVAALIGASAVALSVRLDSLLVAVLGVVGALLSPVLVQAPTSGVALAFMVVAYSANVGVLLWRRWDWLGLAAFVVALPQLFGWAEDAYRQDLGLVLAVLLLFWALNVVAAVGYEVRVPISALRASSALLLAVNVTAAAGLGYLYLDQSGYESGRTAWVLGLALAQLGAGVAVMLRRGVSREIGSLLVAAGLVLSAVGFALALSGPALVVGWAAQAVVLAYLASRNEEGRLKAQGAAVAFIALAALHALAFEARPEALADGVDDLGAAALSLLAVGLAAGLVARLNESSPAATALYYLSGGALVYLGSIVLIDLWGVEETTYGYGQTLQGGQLALSVYWALVGVAAVIVGLSKDLRHLRLGGLSLLGVAVLKVFVVDLSSLDSLYRVVSLLAVGLLLLSGAFAYQRVKRRPGGAAVVTKEEG